MNTRTPVHLYLRTSHNHTQTLHPNNRILQHTLKVRVGVWTRTQQHAIRLQYNDDYDIGYERKALSLDALKLKILNPAGRATSSRLSALRS